MEENRDYYFTSRWMFSKDIWLHINNQWVGNSLSIEKFEKCELLLTDGKHAWVCWSSLHEQSWANTSPSPPGFFLLKLVLSSGTVCVVGSGMPTVVGVSNCLQSFPLDSHWNNEKDSSGVPRGDLFGAMALKE